MHGSTSMNSGLSDSSSGISDASTAGGVTAAGVTAAGMAAAGVAAASAGTATAVNAVSSGDTHTDVREMIKILNLDGPDAGRLQISREQLLALRKGQTENLPDSDTMNKVADKLRHMLA